MSRLLYIEASPMEGLSFSSRVAESFLDAYRSSHPDDTIETLDIWSAPLPVFDGYGVRARYKTSRKQPLDEGEAAAWQQVVATIEHFKGFDKYLLSAPMWNFSIPWRLKQYIDLLVHPGLTFSFSAETGYTGLLTGKKAALIAARGGAYPPDTPGAAWDFQSPYLLTFLGFIGISDVTQIVVEPTMGAAPDTLLAGKEAEARQIAASF